MSLTTTLAPALAMASAMSRPMPPPAPVTTMTLPSSMGDVFMLLASFMSSVPVFRVEAAASGGPLETGGAFGQEVGHRGLVLRGAHGDRL